MHPIEIKEIPISQRKWDSAQPRLQSKSPQSSKPNPTKENIRGLRYSLYFSRLSLSQLPLGKVGSLATLRSGNCELILALRQTRLLELPMATGQFKSPPIIMGKLQPVPSK